jgi:hypothetical protein
MPPLEDMLLGGEPTPRRASRMELRHSEPVGDRVGSTA